MATTMPVDPQLSLRRYSVMARPGHVIPGPEIPVGESWRISSRHCIPPLAHQMQGLLEGHGANTAVSSEPPSTEQATCVFLSVDVNCLSNIRPIDDDATDVRSWSEPLLLALRGGLAPETRALSHELNNVLRHWWEFIEEADKATPPVTPDLVLSSEFFCRLLKFVAWAPGWDGERAEHIDHVTAVRAMEAASSMRPVVSEPFVAPAPSGALLLQWDFTDGSSVEVYVDDETEFPASAALTDDDIVYEIDLSGPGALRSLLAKRGNISATT